MEIKKYQFSIDTDKQLNKIVINNCTNNNLKIYRLVRKTTNL